MNRRNFFSRAVAGILSLVGWKAKATMDGLAPQAPTLGQDKLYPLWKNWTATYSTVDRDEFEKLLIANGITPKKREEEGIIIAPPQL